ncbi:hypothetical protein GHK48_30115 [Sinorhizobium fredii]|uniref:Uncharacterized protein n=1 Tax=Rhizobium fredii TaxID=380 RepID=A0A844AIF0_RHIFR|nr:hypothetical protein [Sinorhizobium fredii]MQX12367.1 hypothetical protein [Sinorhizobium fredii]
MEAIDMLILANTAHPRSCRWPKRAGLLHVSLNRSRFKDKNMQRFKVLQPPLHV